jgi:hypothetical protein
MSAIFGRHPETFRLPPPGEADPYFGLNRSMYYNGEERGYWKLRRIIGPGKTKGITLVPFADVAKYMRSQGGATRKGK